jgi:hypothetical protein
VQSKKQNHCIELVRWLYLKNVANVANVALLFPLKIWRKRKKFVNLQAVEKYKEYGSQRCIEKNIRKKPSTSSCLEHRDR